jgi:hypothetical protein
MSIDTTIVLYPERLFQPRGEVYDWAQRVTDYFVLWAIQEAPVRTGALAGSIWGDVDSVGPEELVMQIGAGADHAEHVVFGTDSGGSGGIAVGSDNPYGKSWPGFARGQYWDRTTYVKGFVRGQDAQNFFARARWHVQGRYRSIGGWSGME